MFSMNFLLGYAEELAKEKRKDKFEILGLKKFFTIPLIQYFVKKIPIG